MASTTRRSTRGKREANKSRECMTAPKQIDNNQDAINILKNRVSEHAQTIEILTKERDEAYDSVSTLRIEVEQLKKILRAGKTEEESESKSFHHVIGRRKKSKVSQDNQRQEHPDEEPNLAANAVTNEATEIHKPKDTNKGDASSLPNFKLAEIKEALKAEQEERAYQKRERRRRAANVIIHGIDEITETKDRVQIEKLFNAVKVKLVPKSFTRLGVKNENKKGRPLKLTMKSINEKAILMKAARNLKNANKDFRKVSIAHDLTIEQRNQVATKVKQAREKTINDSENYVWKVRQTPPGDIQVIRLENKLTTVVDTLQSNPNTATQKRTIENQGTKTKEVKKTTKAPASPANITA